MQVSRFVLGISLLGFWFALVGRVTLPEASLGFFGVGGAVLLAQAAYEAGIAAVRFRLRWMRRAYAVPFRIVSDAARVFAELAASRGRRGRFRRVRFEAGGSDAASMTRRALAVGLTTSFPNTIGIDVDKRRNRLLVHELSPSDGEVLP